MAEGGGISHVLNTLFNSLGLDEAHRQMRMSCQRMSQLLTSWFNESVKCDEVSPLVSGSSHETTTIDGLSSDLDIMLIQQDLRVIEDIQDWRGDGVITYMMDSAECYKAFVRLYLLSSEYPGPAYTDMPVFKHQVDASGRIIRSNAALRDVECIGSDVSLERHGPAITKPGNRETDFVWTLQCESFPKDAVGWKTRQTPLTRTRISPAIIDDINHCYLVGVGNKASALQHLEWRLSFSHIENKLIHNWKNTQYKCYVMMKFIQKDLIKPKVPDILCSYHFKTLMMWMNEEYSSDFFVSVNFEHCLLSCLKNLAVAVETKSLPHYFVDGCNLFYPKITNHPDLARKLTATIRDIISSWPYCLSNITRCNLGNMIKECLLQPASLTGMCRRIGRKRRTSASPYERSREISAIIRIVGYSVHYIETSDKNLMDRMYLLLDLKQRSLQQENDNADKEFISIVIKDFLCNLGLGLIQQTRSMTNKNTLKSLKLGERLMYPYLNCCSIETGLKAAADFITAGNNQRVSMTLDRVQNQIKHYTYFQCMHIRCVNYRKSGFEEVVYDNKPSLVEYHKHYMIGHVAYKQSQMPHVPNGLVYEMFRTIAASSVSDPRIHDDWYSQAVIHCPMYLYYLRFLHHQRQGQEAHRQVALDNMIWAAKDISIAPRTHEDTNHNIIGHCHRTVGNTRRAYKEYRKSLEKEKYNNAVLWHLAVLLRSKIRGDQ